MASTQPTTSTHIITGSGYLQTAQGICNIVQTVASLIGVLLVSIGFVGYIIRIYDVAASVSIIMSVLVLFFYISGLVSNYGISVFRGLMVFHFIWAIYIFVACCLIWAHGNGYVQPIIGSIFGLVATLAHVFNGVDMLRKMSLN